MADHSFGWLCGTDYAPHLSDVDKAAFSAVLVMPWASTTGKWTQDPRQIPILKQADCEQHLGDWLAPWESAVTWRLYALAGRTLREISGTVRKVARPIVAADAGAISQRASSRLHAYVGDSNDAMGFETAEDGRVLTYPIVGGGVSQVPAALSDGVLHTSCIFQVARADLAVGESVVALPTFVARGETIAPAQNGHAPSADPSAVEFVYSGASRRVVAADAYLFSACVSKPVPANEFGGAGKSHPPRRVEIRNGRSMRQIYAALSREFYPLKLWLAAMNEMRVAALGIETFRQMLTQFLGSGEDELDTNGAALGSIY